MWMSKAAKGRARRLARRPLGTAAAALVLLVWLLSRLPRGSRRSQTANEAGIGSLLRSGGAVAGTGQHGKVTGSAVRLLLSTHNRLFWYVPDTQQQIDVHSNQVRAPASGARVNRRNAMLVVPWTDAMLAVLASMATTDVDLPFCRLLHTS
jgi:hypothetical protein